MKFLTKFDWNFREIQYLNWHNVVHKILLQQNTVLVGVNKNEFWTCNAQTLSDPIQFCSRINNNVHDA
jgi:hypothetical protein